MGYTGLTVTIPMGQGGLRTDDSQVVLRPTDLISAQNVNFHSNLIEKDSGSTRLNATAIPSGVLAAYDWWPTYSITDRRTVVVGGDGRVYFIDNSGVVTEVTGGTAPLSTTNQFYFLACGREATTNNRKLFIMNGINPIQVISGTGATKANLTSPNADWGASNQPRAAVLHRGAVFAFGVPSAPHTVYRSSFTNHEDFSTASPTTVRYSVSQGEGEILMAGAVFRGKLFVYKTPAGFYALEDGDNDPTTWYFARVSNILGAASPNSVVEALNDVIAKTPTDGLLSVAATQQFGDVTASNVLEIQNIAQFIRDNTTPDGAPDTWGIYYSEKRTLYFTYQSTTATSPDRLLLVRMETNGNPKSAWITKDAANCLALRKDTQLIPRPIYGSLDGYVYLMDQSDRNVNSSAYTGEFRTPNLDFGFVDARVAGQLDTKNKIYDHLEMRYIPQGDYNIYVDVFIDEEYTETLTFTQEADDLLADAAPAADDFMLSDTADDPDGSLLSGDNAKFLRRRLNGQGRTISFRVYNSGLNENFKIISMSVGFRAGGQQER